ncbi:hypothetical protein RH831_10605 [Halodesulfurarchaeum sp. HSR-GB]|uniref:hypothetical protein n=1 Tax=Halodesulfurarchaeum sp. HSR-GB TaxID=3074077 RepID=UPI002866E880|nr:hypothetical protein [Halodesulfurarchaeum sp. HSR-GB]MDR5657627.1 hypothetical protein [Halodesulfurarchaeum sp. HSR-GB]
MVETLIPNAPEEYLTEALRSANARYKLLTAYHEATSISESMNDTERALQVLRKDPVLSERMGWLEYTWDDVGDMLEDDDWFFDEDDLCEAVALALEVQRQ